MSNLLESGQELDDNFTGLAVRLDVRPACQQADASPAAACSEVTCSMVDRMQMGSSAWQDLALCCQKPAHCRLFLISATFALERSQVIGAYLHTQHLSFFKEV